VSPALAGSGPRCAAGHRIAGERRAQVRVPGPLALDQVLDLGEGHGVAVVRSADGESLVRPGHRRSRPVAAKCAGQGTAKRLVGLLTAGGEQSGSNFAWLGLAHAHRSGDRYRCAGSDGSPPVTERAVDVDQTNESVIVDEQVVVKWMTRLPSAQEPGSPAASRIAALAEAGFVDMPTPYGFLVAGSKVSDGQLLACAVAYLPRAEDGWDWATRDLRDWLRGAARLEQSIAPVGRIGAITARMHAGLARLGIGQVSPQQAADLLQQARAELAEAANAVGGALRRATGRLAAADRCLPRWPWIDVVNAEHRDPR
jgi:maltokinase